MVFCVNWVNNLALNTDYVLRTGPFHPVTDKLKKFSMTTDSKCCTCTITISQNRIS